MNSIMLAAMRNRFPVENGFIKILVNTLNSTHLPKFLAVLEASSITFADFSLLAQLPIALVEMHV